MRSDIVSAIVEAIEKRVEDGKVATTLNQLREQFPDASREEVLEAMRDRLRTRKYKGGHTVNGVPVIRRIYELQD